MDLEQINAKLDAQLSAIDERLHAPDLPADNRRALDDMRRRLVKTRLMANKANELRLAGAEQDLGAKRRRMMGIACCVLSILGLMVIAWLWGKV